MGLSGIVLVTGGAGFIGSSIASALASSGARVRVIDDLSTGYVENLDEIGGDIDFVKASLADDPALRRALEDVELVFHEAAIPSVIAAGGAVVAAILATREDEINFGSGVTVISPSR